MDVKSGNSNKNPGALQSGSGSEPVCLYGLSDGKSCDLKTDENIARASETNDITKSLKADMTGIPDTRESKSEGQSDSKSSQVQLKSTNNSEIDCSDSAIKDCVGANIDEFIYIASEKESDINKETCEGTKNENISGNKVEEWDSSSLTSDSVIDPKREVSSDSDEDEGSFVYQDRFEALRLLRKKMSPPPLFQKTKPELVKIRYTVDEDFRDHFCNGAILDKELLDSILELWASDNWEGLYNPPDWLTPSMFARALTSLTSNKLKREKLIEATANLEISRLTSSNDVPESLKQEALDHIICSGPINVKDSSESFLDQAKRISFVMHKIYSDIKKTLDKEIVEWHTIREELILTITAASDSMNKNIKMQEVFSKQTAETVNLLGTIYTKISAKIINKT